MGSGAGSGSVLGVTTAALRGVQVGVIFLFQCGRLLGLAGLISPATLL